MKAAFLQMEQRWLDRPRTIRMFKTHAPAESVKRKRVAVALTGKHRSLAATGIFVLYQPTVRRASDRLTKSGRRSSGLFPRARSAGHIARVTGRQPNWEAGAGRFATPCGAAQGQSGLVGAHRTIDRSRMRQKLCDIVPVHTTKSESRRLHLVCIIISVQAGPTWKRLMASKRDTAWEMAARLAALAVDADNTEEEREYYLRLRDAWITVAHRCEFFDFPDVTRQ
jgi:hypothetical protein